jgi:ribosomal protein S21
MSKHPKSERAAVDVRNNNVDQAMRRLKKVLTNEGIFQELRDRTQFTTNTEKRLRAEAAGKARWRKKQAKINNS